MNSEQSARFFERASRHIPTEQAHVIAGAAQTPLDNSAQEISADTFTRRKIDLGGELRDIGALACDGDGFRLRLRDETDVNAVLGDDAHRAHLRDVTGLQGAILSHAQSGKDEKHGEKTGESGHGEKPPYRRG